MNIVDYALKFVGCPYVWGGDGSGRCGGGFDCSGLVVECLQAFGLVQGDFTAQSLYKRLSALGWVSVPRGLETGADVVFWGKSAASITHVSLAVGNGLHVEAGGGGSKCKTPEVSTGMVRVRPLSASSGWVAALRRPL